MASLCVRRVSLKFLVVSCLSNFRHNSLRRRSTRIDSRPSLATIATRIDLESRRASIAVTSALSTAARRAATTSGPVRNGVARKFSFVGDNAR